MLNNNEDMAVLYICGYEANKVYGANKCEECQLHIMSGDKSWKLINNISNNV